MKLALACLFLCFAISCQNEKAAPTSWEIIFKNNAAGETLAGDKNVLLNAVRNGYPIRIGFGGRSSRDTTLSIEHIADAQFITIVNGKEVFAQIESIYGQRPNMETDTLSIDIRHENKWTMIIGTNGERSTLSRFFDYNKTAESRASNRGVTWFAKIPEEKKNSSQALW